MIYATGPQRVYAQARATATVTATVIPAMSFELMKSNIAVTKEAASSLTINCRGTENILVIVDSKEATSTNIFQLTTEKPAKIIIPSSTQAGKTSITYLSS